MKTRVIIDIETDKFNKFYNSDDPAEWTDDNIISKEVEQTLHDTIVAAIDKYINDDSFESELFDNTTNEEYFPVGDCGGLEDYGEVSIKIQSEEIIEPKKER